MSVYVPGIGAAAVRVIGLRFYERPEARVSARTLYGCRQRADLGRSEVSPSQAKASLEQLQGYAQLMPRPPELTRADTDAHSAWQCYGAVIFWMHRPGITPAKTVHQSAPHWQRLQTQLRHAAADPLYWLHGASQFRYDDKTPVIEAILRTFPDEIRPILEWSIGHPDDLASVFPHTWRGRQAVLISLLGAVGDSESAEFLRPYVDDPILGTAAIAAIKQLNDL